MENVRVEVTKEIYYLFKIDASKKILDEHLKNFFNLDDSTKAPDLIRKIMKIHNIPKEEITSKIYRYKDGKGVGSNWKEENLSKAYF